jgi:hypothetical protein
MAPYRFSALTLFLVAGEDTTGTASMALADSTSPTAIKLK